MLSSNPAWQATASVLSYLTLMTGHLIFLLRTYALYSRARLILIICVPLFLAEGGIVSYSLYSLIVIGSHQWQSEQHYWSLVSNTTWAPHLIDSGVLPFAMPMAPVTAPSQRCMPGVASDCASVLAWTMPFLFDSVILALTLRRSLQVARADQRTPLLRVLIRDGTHTHTPLT